MSNTNTPELRSQRSTVAFDGSEELADGAWAWTEFCCPAIEPQPVAQEPTHYAGTLPGWSVKHDFERRLNRNGIKVSEARDSRDSKNTVQPVVQQRGGALSILDGYARIKANHAFHYASRSKDFPSFQPATMASFTNTKKETKIEALERQLRQAHAESQVWKRHAERQEQDLRASCKETMDWRMRYEDLYSAVLQDVDIEPEVKPKRGATRSLG